MVFLRGAGGVTIAGCTGSAEDRPQCGQTVGKVSTGSNDLRCRRM